MLEGDADGGDDSSESVVEIDPDEADLGNVATFMPEKRTTNIVMIDDMKMLKELADAARKLGDAEAEAVKERLKGGASLMPSMKTSSGVTITPAKPRTLPLPLGGTLLGSGVTISPSGVKPQQRKVDVPLPAGTTLTSVKSHNIIFPSAGNGATLHPAFSSNKQGQLKDPNLTDDTFVVEAPSFIAPYIYEKPPKETLKEFKDSIQKLITSQESDVDDTKDEKRDPEKKEDKFSAPEEAKKAASDAGKYFESSLGKFVGNLGMNLVQEHVQHDLLREQTRRAQKDKSAVVMHAIILLKKNLEASKDTNESFRFDMNRCRMCSFKTESILALENHLEVPHFRNGLYRCYYCPEEAKTSYDIVNHMALMHGIRGRMERPPAPHQCPQCPFEDNLRGKVNRHKASCDKRFRSEHNQEPPHDWEPPAKIPKPSPFNRAMKPNMIGGFGSSLAMPSGFGFGLRPVLPTGFNGLSASFQNNSRSIFPNLPQLQFGPRGRGRPVGSYKPGFQPGSRLNLPNFPTAPRPPNQMGLVPSNNQPVRFQNSNNSILNSLGANPSLTIQSISQRNQSSAGGQPSISITPLSGRGVAPVGKPSTNQPNTPTGAPKPNKGKRDIVICEICDGYIKDLEQLKNHMQWIHKVQIHPKMIYNRPPLNCQKCQFRFFTDQGLERHLLGSHGLVTASMQELANKNQDSGRCPICGKVYQWKLLNHVSKGHNKTLKPAHLSYKCTVCTATFEQYKLFETHVYSAHSSNKRPNNGEASQASKPPEKMCLSEKLALSKSKQEIPSLGVSLLKKSLPAVETVGVAKTLQTECDNDNEDEDESGDDGVEEILDDE